MLSEKKICIGKNMGVIQRMLNAFLKVRLEGEVINPSEFIFLLHLRFHHGISQESLNEVLKFDKGFVAKMAQALEKKGMIQRTINPQDRRAYCLLVTDKGEGLYPKMDAILNEWTQVLYGDESLEALHILDAALEEIAHRAIEKVERIKNGKA